MEDDTREFGIEPDTEVDTFARQHGGALLRFTFMITGGRAAEAEDLVQSVLLRLTSRGLAGIEDPLAYARRAVLNEHASVTRRATVALRALPRLLDRHQNEPTPAADERFTVLQALQNLSVREREAIVLRYYEDLDDVTIARYLGCRRATVRSLIHRALPKLRVALDPDNSEPTRVAEENR